MNVSDFSFRLKQERLKKQQQMAEQKTDWRLQKIELEFQRFGENQGKYIGKIRFENGDYESFEFKIHPEMSKPYIDLISADIVTCADSLGQRLKESLGLTNDPK